LKRVGLLKREGLLKRVQMKKILHTLLVVLYKGTLFAVIELMFCNKVMRSRPGIVISVFGLLL